MIEEKITYEDFDGKTTVATFHFGLSKVELIELELDDGDNVSMRKRLEKISKGKNNLEIFRAFQEIIRLGVGRRNGNHFEKTPEITADLTKTNAYDAFVFKMLGDPAWAAKFITNMLPKDMVEKLEEANELPSADELLSMSEKRFYKTVGRDRKNWSKEITLIANQRKQQKIAS